METYRHKISGFRISPINWQLKSWTGHETNTNTHPDFTYHDLRHSEQHREEGVESRVAVFDASFALQSTPVHAHVPVGQLVDKLHQPWHHGVQPVRCRTHKTDVCTHRQQFPVTHPAVRLLTAICQFIPRTTSAKPSAGRRKQLN